MSRFTAVAAGCECNDTGCMGPVGAGGKSLALLSESEGVGTTMSVSIDGGFFIEVSGASSAKTSPENNNDSMNGNIPTAPTLICRGSRTLRRWLIKNKPGG